MKCNQCGKEVNTEDIVISSVYNDDTEEYEDFHMCKECDRKFNEEIEKAQEAFIEAQKEFDIMQEERDKTFLSYPNENTEKRFCSCCGELLRYNSINYMEGFHTDGCLI